MNSNNSNMSGQNTNANEKDGAGDSNYGEIDKTKLIINYIPQYTKEQELHLIFSKVGSIENIQIMRDYKSGYSYGFGFIKYTNCEDAAKAIECFNGWNFRNKRLKVSYARPPSKDMKNSNLYITNLPKDITEKDIDDMFGEFGEIIHKTILKDKITGMPRGVAFVRFSKTDEAQAAIAALNGKHLDNTMFPLSVRVAEKHGRQKAEYIYLLDQECLYHNRDFGRNRMLLPFREYRIGRGSFMSPTNCPLTNYMVQCTGGAGDNFYPNYPSRNFVL